MNPVYISSMKDEGYQVFRLAEKYGLGIELLDFIEPYMVNDFSNKVEELQAKLLNIPQRALHGPFFDLFPASRDPEIKKVVKMRFVQAYQTAARLGAKHIVFHAGFNPKAHRPKSWLADAVSFWQDFVSCLGPDINIYVENVSLDDYEVLKDLVDAVNNPLLSICLDVGHVNVSSPKRLEEWIRSLNKNIGYVHLHNNNGNYDSHRGLKKGQIDMYETLNMLQEYAPDATWSLETQLEETEESIHWLKQKGFIS